MAAPLLMRLLPHLLAAAGHMGMDKAKQQGLGSLITNPRGAGRSFFRERGAPGVGRYVFGTRETMPYRQEMWADFRRNLQDAAPELKAFGDLTREAKGAFQDVTKGGLGGLLSGLLRMTRAVDRTSASLIEMQSVLGQYSGPHAMALAQLEVDRIYRSIEMGRATGPSFQHLTQARSRFEEAMMPFRRAGTILSDRVVAVVTDVLATGLRVLEKLEPVTELIELFLKGDEKDPSKGTAEPFLDLLGKGLGVSPRNRRRRF